MRKRVLSMLLSAALVVNPFSSIQVVKANQMNGIPIQLMKKADTGTGEEESGTYNQNGNSGKIDPRDISKSPSSIYLNKAYYQTELSGKPVKSLEWLDQGKGLIKYELSNEPTLPSNVELYYNKDEESAKANYYFTGGKADVSFNLLNNSSNRVDVVNENGMALTNEEVYLGDTQSEVEYTFLVQTKTGMRDTKITVKMTEDQAGEMELVPSDNLSTLSQITLKYTVKVKKGSQYIFSVDGVENTGVASFKLHDEVLSTVEPHNGSLDEGYYHYTKPKLSAYSLTNIIANEQKEVIFSENIVADTSKEISANIVLNICGWKDNRAYNVIADYMSIGGEFVQVPAPPVSYCHQATGKDNHWTELKAQLKDDTFNPPAITTFTTGKLAGSTATVKITDIKVSDSIVNGIGLVYTVTLTNPPKEVIPINIRIEPMSQGYIAKAETKGIKDLSIYCNSKGIWSSYGASDTSDWVIWKEDAIASDGTKVNKHWLTPLGKAIKGNMNRSNIYDLRQRIDTSTYKENTIVKDGKTVTTSDQVYKVKFQVEDGYVNPKVAYSHQELNVTDNKPIVSNHTYDLEKGNLIAVDTKTLLVDNLVVPRYGEEYNPETTDQQGTGVFVGNLSSLLFQVELLELPVELDQQNGTEVNQIGLMDVQARKTLQIPDAIPEKQGNYFTGYHLYKVKDGVEELINDKYYYPGQVLSLSDVGTFAVDGKKIMDKVKLVAVYGEENQNTAGKVVVKTILKNKDGSFEVYDQKVLSVADNTYVRINEVASKITKDADSIFKFSEADTTMSKVVSTSVTRVVNNSLATDTFSLDGKVTATQKVFEIVYIQEGQTLELFEAGTNNKIPNNIVVAGSNVKVSLSLKKADTLPETVQVKVPGRDELVTLTKVAGDTGETVLYQADNILVTKAETGTVIIAEQDKGNIPEVEKIQNPSLTVAAGSPSNQHTTLVVSPSSITVTGSSIGTITLKDAYGNPIKDGSPVIKVNGTDLSLDKITNNGDGTYGFLYTPDSVGNKKFDLMDEQGQEMVTDTVTVESGSGTISITKAGNPIDKIEVHSKFTITVTVQDEGNNPPNELKVNVPGVEGEVILQRQANGSYVGTAEPTKPATGEVTIIDAGYSNITPKPITITAGKPNSDKSIITVSPNSVLVGEPVKGTIELKDDDGNPVTGVTPEITVNGQIVPMPDGGVKELGDGKYEFTYIPDTPENKKIGVSVDHVPVNNTTLIVKDVDGTITVTKDGQPVGEVTVKDKIDITVELKDQEGVPPTEIKVTVPGVDGEVTLTKQPDGTYKGSVTLTKPETGNIIVNDNRYPNIKPVPVKVIERAEDADGNITITKDGQPVTNVVVKDKIDITVELKDPEEVPPTEIKVTVPGVDGEVTLTKQPDGTYKGSATPTKPAIGNIVVNDKKYPNIKPVPVNIAIGEPDSNNSTLVVNPNPIKVGESATGTLNLKDKNGNPITGKKPVIAVDGTPIDGEVVEKQEGEYSFTYTPNNEGSKTITASVDGKETIKYTIQVIPPSFPNRGNGSLPFIDSVDNATNGTIIGDKDKTEDKDSEKKPSINGTTDGEDNKKKPSNNNKKDEVVNDKKKDQNITKTENTNKDSNSNIKDFERIPTNTNTSTNNSEEKKEYTNWYYDTLDTKDNTFLTTRGLEVLEQLPKGTQIGEIKGVNYNKLGLQSGRVRVVLPDGTVKYIPVEVAVLTNVQVKAKGLHAGDIYDVGVTQEIGKDGFIQGTNFMNSLIPKTGDRSLLSVIVMLLMSGVVIVFQFRRKKLL